MKPSLIVVCLALGLAACSDPINCSGGDYRGGCIVGAAGPLPTIPLTANPVPVSHPAMPFGDPATFADVDDRQCRSYGLPFGGHDYAECRIRLSAQHRGLDPSIGAAPGAGSR